MFKVEYIKKYQMKNLLNGVNEGNWKIFLESKLFSSSTNTFQHNQSTKSFSINKEDYNQRTKTCCYSLYTMDYIIKNMQKMWCMID